MPPVTLHPRSRFHTVVAMTLFLAMNGPVSAKTATIRLPEQFASNSSPISLTGFSGYNRGHYEGGEFRGEFTRIESRLGVFDPLYVANRGKSGFTLEDSAGTPFLQANCSALERTISIRFVVLDLKKLTYACEFSGLEAAGDMNFVLGEPKREGFRERLMARERRTGEASVLGHDLVFESVHEYENSRFTSQAPLGYLVKVNDNVVAAVDLLDWDPVVHLDHSLAETERQAAMVVALALAVLRDPANSVLEDLADLD